MANDRLIALQVRLSESESVDVLRAELREATTADHIAIVVADEYLGTEGERGRWVLAAIYSHSCRASQGLRDWCEARALRGEDVHVNWSIFDVQGMAVWTWQTEDGDEQRVDPDEWEPRPWRRRDTLLTS